MPKRGELFTQFFFADLSGLNIFKPLFSAVKMIQERLDRSAIFSFEPRKIGKASLYFLQSFRREFEAAPEVAQGDREVIDHGLGRPDSGNVFTKSSLVVRQFVDLAGGFFQGGDGRFRIVVKQRVGVFAERGELLDV